MAHGFRAMIQKGKEISPFIRLSCIILVLDQQPLTKNQGEMRMSTYNGWSNWETWKTNLEMLDGMDAQDLGIDHYDVKEAYEASSIVKEYVEEIIAMQYQYDGFVGGIIYEFMNNVNWFELARGILEQWKIDNPEEVEDSEE